jgi:aminoacrylate hydrolase
MPEAGGLYYEEHGSGPPLILSSGMGGSGNYWLPNLAAFAEHFRVILYDHRGTGRSDRTVTPRIESIGDDIRLLMDELGIERASIVGHAIGGMGALNLTLDTPDRVEKLVVVNGWGRPDPYTDRCFEARLIALRARGPAAYVYVQPIFLYPPDWVSEHHFELEEEEDRQVANFPREMIEQRILEAVKYYLIEYLEQRPLTLPVLLLSSEDDGLVPPHCSAELAAVIPGARRASMPWGGHACNVTDPDTFNRLVLDFLGE